LSWVYFYHRAEEIFGNLFDPLAKNSSNVVALSHKGTVRRYYLRQGSNLFVGSFERLGAEFQHHDPATEDE
jgi:hypothetical protein